MNPASSQPFDFDAYLSRIAYDGPLAATPEVLQDLHLAHATHIPFENLDIQLCRPIRLDLDSLQAKLVRARRGGYCFEQNTLFMTVLEALGFRVTRLAARVRFGTTHVLPRSHLVLRVEWDGTPWLADVGFGTVGLLQPIPMVPGQVVRQYAWSYRLLEESGLWVLQSLLQGIWQDLYAFTLEPQIHVDVEVANHYVSTHPDSRFVQTLTVQLSSLEARYILRNWEFTTVHGDVNTSRTLEDHEAVLRLLADTFRLHFPSGTRFRCLQER
jgi:N-hydroxyarylamine O-acetyltransferase